MRSINAVGMMLRSTAEPAKPLPPIERRPLDLVNPVDLGPIAVGDGEPDQAEVTPNAPGPLDVLIAAEPASPPTSAAPLLGPDPQLALADPTPRTAIEDILAEMFSPGPAVSINHPAISPAPAPPTPAELAAVEEIAPQLIEPRPLAEAKRVAFLVDASGSQIDTLPLIVQHLGEQIGQLRDDQQFTVIFFQGNRALEAPPAGLKPATDSNQLRAARWMNPAAGQVLAMGSSNPVTALRLAAGYRPDQIVIYSDQLTGRRPGQVGEQALFDMLDQIADEHSVQINTVHFFYEDPSRTLERIAHRYHGAYEFVEQPERVEAGEPFDLGSMELIKD